MPNSCRQQPVYDEYGELIGLLETSDYSDLIRVLDPDGNQLATTRSIHTGTRHLQNVAYDNKKYASNSPAGAKGTAVTRKPRFL